MSEGDYTGRALYSKKRSQDLDRARAMVERNTPIGQISDDRQRRKQADMFLESRFRETSDRWRHGKE